MGTGPGQGFREEGVAVQARRQSLAGAYLVQGAPRGGPVISCPWGHTLPQVLTNGLQGRGHKLLRLRLMSLNHNEGWAGLSAYTCCALYKGSLISSLQTILLSSLNG